MERLALLLVVAMLVAGCTVLPQDDGEQQQGQRGLVIEQASFESSTVQRGRSTRLIVRVANTNPVPITDFSAELSNLGGITASSVEPAGGCSGEISAASTSPGTMTCVWQLDTSSLGSDDTGSYPVALTMEYTGTLTMQEGTPTFSFTDDLPSRQTTTSSYTNGELRMDVTHRSEHAATADAVPVDITLRSPGSGRIRPQDDVRRVTLSYGGSLMDVFGFTDGNTDTEPRCTRANFLTGETSTTITCNLFRGGTIAAGTTYSLRVTATYPYQQYREIPLRVVEE